MDNIICRIDNLTFSYRTYPVLKGITMTLKQGECLAICGASGSGKSTLGKILAGYIETDTPSITWSKEMAIVENRLENCRKRQLVFQDPSSALSLFYTPFRTIFETLKLHFPEDTHILNQQTSEILNQFGLKSELFHKKIHLLSGGQKQRLAIARAFCVRPKLLVLDEPLSSCDVFLQKEILDLIKTSIKQFNLTCCFILHDLAQAAYIADTLCLLQNGQIEAEGPIDEVLKNPPTEYARAFFESSILS